MRALLRGITAGLFGEGQAVGQLSPTADPRITRLRDEMIMPNQRAGVDAGCAVLFAFECACPAPLITIVRHLLRAHTLSREQERENALCNDEVGAGHGPLTREIRIPTWTLKASGLGCKRLSRPVRRNWKPNAPPIARRRRRSGVRTCEQIGIERIFSPPCQGGEWAPRNSFTRGCQKPLLTLE